MKPFILPTSRQRLATALAAAALSLLAACGGGLGGGDAGTPPTGGTPAATDTAVQVSGTITGFGSVIIDGIRYDDSAAAVSIDNGGRDGAKGTLGDLKLGMSVDAKVQGGKVLDVLVRARLAGPVDAVDAAGGSFTVYGQTVRVVTSGATTTMFEGVAGLARLAAGDRVEVHGTVDAARAIIASRVERKPRDEAMPTVRIGGVVTALDAAAGTFRFNGLTVDVSGAAVEPDGKVLADGQVVVAFGDAPPAAGRFVAKALHIVGADEGTVFGIGGRITQFVSAADFTVSGVRVDAGLAEVEGGSTADLAPGVVVRAQGTIKAGVLVADRLGILKTAADAQSSLTGQVSDFVSASSFRLRGTAVDAGTVVYEGGAVSDLGNGSWIKVEGKAQGDVFKATKVEFLKPPTAQLAKVTGEMRDWNSASGTMTLMGNVVKVGADTVFANGAADRLANGRRIAVTGTPDADGILLARRIVFLGEVIQSVTVGGRVSEVGAGAFKLPGIDVTFGPETVVEEGTLADLANGVIVIVRGRFVPTTRSIAATSIDILKAVADVPRVTGPVGEVRSIGDFTVSGQRVDAGAAELVGGSAADVAPGAIVMAAGTVVERDGGRVLLASKLRFLAK